MPDSALLQELERRLDRTGSRPSRERSAVSTGVEPLDALLPGGGLPRGEATEWLGPRSCGKTAFLRAAFAHLRASGEPVALVDARRTLYAPDWTGLRRGGSGLWVIRPSDPEEASWCADLLLRSGAFGGVGLVLGEGRPPGARAVTDLGRSATVRLQRLAEETGAVFVAVGKLPVAALRLRFRPGRVEPVDAPLFGSFLPDVRPVWVRVMRRGDEAEVPVLCPSPALRTSPPTGRDRKGRR